MKKTASMLLFTLAVAPAHAQITPEYQNYLQTIKDGPSVFELILFAAATALVLLSMALSFSRRSGLGLFSSVIFAVPLATFGWARWAYFHELRFSASIIAIAAVGFLLGGLGLLASRFTSPRSDPMNSANHG